MQASVALAVAGTLNVLLDAVGAKGAIGAGGQPVQALAGEGADDVGDQAANDT